MGVGVEQGTGMEKMSDIMSDIRWCGYGVVVLGGYVVVVAEYNSYARKRGVIFTGAY
jgi:hypothetical protein